MLAHDFAPGFRIELHIKDLLNALGTSHAVDAPLPLTAAVLEMMTALRAAGHERDDHSSLVQHYESLAQTRLVPDQT
jgi:3-hydroxyisobutyrate dehydrogenase-like beta-hydroxyacid dehydrogenase